MAQVVILGLEGEEGLWIADLGAGTVTPFKDKTAGALAAGASAGRTGVVAKGVDFAVAIAAVSEAAAGHFEGR